MSFLSQSSKATMGADQLSLHLGTAEITKQGSRTLNLQTLLFIAVR